MGNLIQRYPPPNKNLKNHHKLMSAMFLIKSSDVHFTSKIFSLVTALMIGPKCLFDKNLFY